MTRRQLSQLLAFLSKFPTLLFYKMMGITPLVNNTMNQNYPIRCKVTNKFVNYKILNNQTCWGVMRRAVTLLIGNFPYKFRSYKLEINYVC